MILNCFRGQSQIYHTLGFQRPAQIYTLSSFFSYTARKLQVFNDIILFMNMPVSLI